MGQFFIYNDNAYNEGTPVIGVGNRSLRYGDGIFETMKMLRGKIINNDLHFERLFHGLNVLQFDIPKTLNKEFLERKIHELSSKNNHTDAARIRLMLFRGDGGIFDVIGNDPGYIIETVAISSELALNDAGYILDIFPGARKSYDIFSNLKTNNYLRYSMAGLYAKKNHLDDCIILNSSERICDSVIANVFIVKNKKIYTPPLSEACVAGTTRRCFLEKNSFKHYDFIEKILTENDLLDAEEMFLTNSVYHIRWIKKFKNKTYTNTFTKEIYNHFLRTVVQ